MEYIFKVIAIVLFLFFLIIYAFKLKIKKNNMINNSLCNKVNLELELDIKKILDVIKNKPKLNFYPCALILLFYHKGSYYLKYQDFRIEKNLRFKLIQFEKELSLIMFKKDIFNKSHWKDSSFEIIKKFNDVFYLKYYDNNLVTFFDKKIND